MSLGKKPLFDVDSTSRRVVFAYYSPVPPQPTCLGTMALERAEVAMVAARRKVEVKRILEVK